MVAPNHKNETQAENISPYMNSKITLEARGLLAFIDSCGKVLRREELMSSSQSLTKNKLNSLLTELTAFGLINTNRTRTEKGYFEWGIERVSGFGRSPLSHPMPEAPPIHEGVPEALSPQSDKAAKAKAKSTRTQKREAYVTGFDEAIALEVWLLYRTEVVRAGFSCGTRGPFMLAWDDLHKIEIAAIGSSGDLSQRILDGTHAFFRRERSKVGEKQFFAHGENFLKKRKWQDALDWDSMSSIATVGEKYNPFILVWNQDSPAAWPQADQNDLTTEVVQQIEKLVGFCKERAIEIFQNGLLFAKDDKYWSFEANLTLKEYLYSGKINDWNKKYLHRREMGLEGIQLVDLAAKHKTDIQFNKQLKYLEDLKDG